MAGWKSIGKPLRATGSLSGSYGRKGGWPQVGIRRNGLPKTRPAIEANSLACTRLSCSFPQPFIRAQLTCKGRYCSPARLRALSPLPDRTFGGTSRLDSPQRKFYFSVYFRQERTSSLKEITRLIRPCAWFRFAVERLPAGLRKRGR